MRKKNEWRQIFTKSILLASRKGRKFANAIKSGISGSL